MRVLPAASLCLFLLLGGVAAADDGPVPLRPEDFELLPLNDLEQQELRRDHPTLARRVALLTARLGRLRTLLGARMNPEDDGSKKIAAQIGHVRARLAPLMAEVVVATGPMGVDADLLRLIARAPRGPARLARYAMDMVGQVADMPERQRTLFQKLLPRIEGGLLALSAARRRLRSSSVTPSHAKEETPSALSAHIDAQMRRIERRFWFLVDTIVPEAQRAAIHRRLPTAYQKQESIVEHIYALPGLSPSQAVQLRTLLTEFEAEAAPDAAAVKRLERRLRAGDPPASERHGLQVELNAARLRQIALLRDAVDRAHGILTAAQWVSLEAIAPRVSISDRRQTSRQLLEGISLTVVQRRSLARMRKSLQGPRRQLQDRRLAAMARMKDYGRDSPQMAGMQMQLAGIQGRGGALQRAFNKRCFLELLTANQILAWVLD